MLRKLLAVCCPKRSRRFRKAFAEQAAEVGRIIKTDQLRDMADIKLCMQKQRAGPGVSKNCREKKNKERQE